MPGAIKRQEVVNLALELYERMFIVNVEIFALYIFSRH